MSHAWMPLAIDDYLADTRHLTTLEHGACMLLAMHLWRKGSLPQSEKMIAKYARLSDEEWKSSRDKILGFFEIDKSGYSAFERAQGKHRKRSIPSKVRRAVVARDGFKCVYCGDESGPFEIDHKMPWSRGGRHDEDNLCVACKACNSMKSALTDAEFISAIAGGIQ